MQNFSIFSGSLALKSSVTKCFYNAIAAYIAERVKEVLKRKHKHRTRARGSEVHSAVLPSSSLLVEVLRSVSHTLRQRIIWDSLLLPFEERMRHRITFHERQRLLHCSCPITPFGAGRASFAHRSTRSQFK